MYKPNEQPQSGSPAYGSGYGGQPSSGYPAQGTGYPAQGTGYPQQGTGYPQQGTGYPQQGTGYPAQGTAPQPTPSYPPPTQQYAQQQSAAYPQPQYSQPQPQYGQPQGPPPQQNAYPAYQPQPVGIVGAAATALDTPARMLVGDVTDSVLLKGKNTILLVICAVAAVGTIIGIISLIVSFSIGLLIGTIVALCVSLGCGWFCSETFAEFNKTDRVFRMLRRRFIFALCDQRDVLVEAPFANLGEPFAETAGHPPSCVATVWLPVQGHPNIRIGAFQFTNDIDLQRELLPWKNYVGRLRGPVSAATALINAVHGVAAGLQSTVAGAAYRI